MIATDSSAATLEVPTTEEFLEALASADFSPVEIPQVEAITKPTVKKTVTASARVAGIKAATLMLAPIEALYITYKEWNGGNSFVVKLPSIPEVVKSLDHSQDSKDAIAILRELRKSVSTLTKGDASQTWVFHESGAFALYSRMDG